MECLSWLCVLIFLSESIQSNLIALFLCVIRVWSVRICTKKMASSCISVSFLHRVSWKVSFSCFDISKLISCIICLMSIIWEMFILWSFSNLIMNITSFSHYEMEWMLDRVDSYYSYLSHKVASLCICPCMDHQYSSIQVSKRVLAVLCPWVWGWPLYF